MAALEQVAVLRQAIQALLAVTRCVRTYSKVDSPQRLFGSLISYLRAGMLIREFTEWNRRCDDRGGCCANHPLKPSPWFLFMYIRECAYKAQPLMPNEIEARDRGSQRGAIAKAA